MASKRVIIVVDRAAELSCHWQTSLRDIVADVVSYFHPEGSTTQDPEARKPTLGLVVFSSEGHCTETQVLGWTSELKTFLAWLSVIEFTSRKCSERALSIALSTALEAIAAARDVDENPGFCQSHCILVTSYKSLPFHIMDIFSVDATIVARNFVQAFVSLSIISPHQSPRLREIFWAGNDYNPRADCSDDQGNLELMILLSDNFMEARAALIYRNLIMEPADENNKDADVQMISDNVSQVLPINEPQTSLVDKLNEIKVWLLESDIDDGVNCLQENNVESSTNHHDAITNNILPVDEKMASFLDATNQPEASPLQKLELDTRVYGGTLTAFALTPRDTTMSWLKIHEENQITDFKSQDPNAVASKALCITNPLEIHNYSRSQTNGKGIMSSLPVNPEARLINPGSTQYSTDRLELGGHTNNYYWIPTLNSHWGIGTSRDVMVNSAKYSKESKLKATKKAKMEWKVQDEDRKKKRLANGAGPSNTLVFNNSSPYLTVERVPWGYVKAWEGGLKTAEDGILVMNRMVVYKELSTSNTLFSDWPHRLNMQRLVPKIQVDNMLFIGEVEYLLVDAILTQSKINQMVNRDMCACIRMPQKTLILFPYVKNSRFVAALYNGVLDFPIHPV